jgi:uncharacterized membrane protein
MIPAKKEVVSRGLLGLLFVGAGVAHFTHAQFFDRLVPDSLTKYRREIGWVTGMLQVVGGVSIFFPHLRGLARWSMIGLLVPTFREGINQVRHPERMKELGIPPILAWLRLPAQVLVIAWIWWTTRDAQRPR